MTRRSEPPAWARPGARWVPWFYWPMLCLSTAVLVWRVVDGDTAGEVTTAALLCVAFASLLIANRRHRRQQRTKA
ncbi:hypothetical protein ACWGII_15525 [Streptomyces sp. NPDC054855]